MKPEDLYAEMSGKDLRELVIRKFGEAALTGSLEKLEGEARKTINHLISDVASLSPEFMIALMASGPKAGGTLIALVLMAILAGAALQDGISKKEAETKAVVE